MRFFVNHDHIKILTWTFKFFVQWFKENASLGPITVLNKLNCIYLPYGCFSSRIWWKAILCMLYGRRWRSWRSRLKSCMRGTLCWSERTPCSSHWPTMISCLSSHPSSTSPLAARHPPSSSLINPSSSTPPPVPNPHRPLPNPTTSPPPEVLSLCLPAWRGTCRNIKNQKKREQTSLQFFFCEKRKKNQPCLFCFFSCLFFLLPPMSFTLWRAMLHCAVLCGLPSIRQSSCERFPVLWPHAKHPQRGLAQGCQRRWGDYAECWEEEQEAGLGKGSLAGLLEAALGRGEACRRACPATASPVYRSVCWCWFCGMSFDRELDTLFWGRMNALFRKAGVLGGMVSLVFTFGFKSSVFMLEELRIQ